MVDLRRERPWQAFVEHAGYSLTYLRSRLHLPAPIHILGESHVHPVQQVAGHLLDLIAFRWGQIWSRPCEEVKHRQLLLGQPLANVPLLFI